MAKKGDTDDYDYNQSLNQPPLQLCLRNYEGPYDRSALQRARDELLYHVERARNTAVWRRIQTKTIVNVNGVRNINDGFGEASNSYSHSGLAEDEEFNESCEDHVDDSMPVSISVDFQEKPGTSFAHTKDNNQSKSLNDNESNYLENEKDNKVMENINVKVNVSGISQGSSNYSQDMEENDLFAEGFSTKQEHDKTMLEKHGKGKNNDENITTDAMVFRDNENKTELKQDAKGDISDDSKNEKSEEVDGNLASQPSQTLKCDYCDFKSLDMANIREHLQNAVHYSASRYNIDSSGGIILIDELTAKNEKAKFKTTVIKCPVKACKSIFPKMKECVDHYNDKHRKHENQPSQFALVDIMNENECSIQVKPLQCNICSLTFKTKGSMKSHLEEKHFPKSSTLSKCKDIFFCRYCKKSFSCLDILIPHLRKHKPVLNVVFKFTVFQVDNVRKFQISSSGRVEQIEDISVISNLGKRSHDQAFPRNDENIKILCKKDSEGREVVFEDRADQGHVTIDEVGIVRYEQSTSISDEEINTGISIRKPKCQETDLPIQKRIENYGKSLKDVFSCDYCQEMSDSEEQMLSHLNEKCHISASLVLFDADKNTQYIKCLSTISVESSHQKAYAMCPENCKTLFGSVKLNIEHYILYHSSVTEFKPCYGVVNVSEEVELKLLVDKCVMCDESCRKTKHLASHYKKKHYPFPPKDGCDLFFRCFPCQRIFAKFENILSHAKKHMDLQKENQFEISVLYLERKIRKQELSTKFSYNIKQNEDVQNLLETIHSVKLSCKAFLKNDVRKKLKKSLDKAKNRLLRIIT